MVARVVELEDANARDEHLDAVDRVLLSVTLERVNRLVKHGAGASAELSHELVTRVRGVGEADAGNAVREVVDELGDFVAVEKQAL
jgi:hypothetical protein